MILIANFHLYIHTVCWNFSFGQSDLENIENPKRLETIKTKEKKIEDGVWNQSESEREKKEEKN